MSSAEAQVSSGVDAAASDQPSVNAPKDGGATADVFMVNRGAPLGGLFRLGNPIYVAASAAGAGLATALLALVSTSPLEHRRLTSLNWWVIRLVLPFVLAAATFVTQQFERHLPRLTRSQFGPPILVRPPDAAGETSGVEEVNDLERRWRAGGRGSALVSWLFMLLATTAAVAVGQPEYAEAAKAGPISWPSLTSNAALEMSYVMLLTYWLLHSVAFFWRFRCAIARARGELHFRVRRFDPDGRMGLAPLGSAFDAYLIAAGAVGFWLLCDRAERAHLPDAVFAASGWDQVLHVLAHPSAVTHGPAWSFAAALGGFLVTLLPASALLVPYALRERLRHDRYDEWTKLAPEFEAKSAQAQDPSKSELEAAPIARWLTVARERLAQFGVIDVWPNGRARGRLLTLVWLGCALGTWLPFGLVVIAAGLVITNVGEVAKKRVFQG